MKIDYSFICKNLSPRHTSQVLLKWIWIFFLILSISISIYLSYFIISSPWEWVWLFISTKRNPLNPIHLQFSLLHRYRQHRYVDNVDTILGLYHHRRYYFPCVNVINITISTMLIHVHRHHHFPSVDINIVDIAILKALLS